MNQFFRTDPVFPRELTSCCLFFGDNGCGAQWAVRTDEPGSIIQWDASWGAEFEIMGATPAEAWRIEKQLYEDADDENR